VSYIHKTFLISAFGRCGDLSTAFTLVDEMAEKKVVISGETFNFLLQACITDKEAGFRHTLLVNKNQLSTF
jgi:pentatricopeptide repeat domain-containing protein 1